MASRKETLVLERSLPGERLDAFLRRKFPPSRAARFIGSSSKATSKSTASLSNPRTRPAAGEAVEIEMAEPDRPKPDPKTFRSTLFSRMSACSS